MHIFIFIYIYKERETTLLPCFFLVHRSFTEDGCWADLVDGTGCPVQLGAEYMSRRLIHSGLRLTFPWGLVNGCESWVLHSDIIVSCVFC